MWLVAPAVAPVPVPPHACGLGPSRTHDPAVAGKHLARTRLRKETEREGGVGVSGCC